MKLSDKSSFYVVGIGLSIGGIDPLTEILSCLPVQSKAAFLIIQYLDRAYPSKLAERLQPFTKLKVNVARPGMALESSQVYVLAEGQMMTIEGGRMVLRARHADEKVKQSGRYFILFNGQGPGEADRQRSFRAWTATAPWVPSRSSCMGVLPSRNYPKRPSILPCLNLPSKAARRVLF